MNSINKIHGTVIHDARITEDMVEQLEGSSLSEMELWPSEDETKDGWELSNTQKFALQVIGKQITLILHAVPKSYEKEQVNEGGVIPEETEKTIKGTIEIKDNHYGIADGNDWYYLDAVNSILTSTQIEVKTVPDVQLLDIYCNTLKWNGGKAVPPTDPGTTQYFYTYGTMQSSIVFPLVGETFDIKTFYNGKYYASFATLTAALNADGFSWSDIDFSKMICPSGQLRLINNYAVAYLNGLVTLRGTDNYDIITWAISSVLSDDGKSIEGYNVTCLCAKEMVS